MPKGPYFRTRKENSKPARAKVHFLREWREYFGWTQEMLAAAAGLSTGAISGYERNENDPSLATLSLLAHALKVTAGMLLDIDPHEVKGGVVRIEVPPPNWHEQAKRRAK